MSVINTNITSMIGQQNLNKSQNALQTSMERLSSGLRINSAKDDAAGQAIANRMTAQVTGLAQAQRNANDGISIAQTTEGGLNQVNDNLQRIRELTVQASNGTNSQNDLQSIQDEIGQRLSEIDRISRETDFNGTRVLSEETEALTIQVGSEDGQTITVNLRTINSQSLELGSFNVTNTMLSDNIGTDAITKIGIDSPFESTKTATIQANAEADILVNIQDNSVDVTDSEQDSGITGGKVYDATADGSNTSGFVIEGSDGKLYDLQKNAATDSYFFDSGAGATTSSNIGDEATTTYIQSTETFDISGLQSQDNGLAGAANDADFFSADNNQVYARNDVTDADIAAGTSGYVMKANDGNYYALDLVASDAVADPDNTNDTATFTISGTNGDPSTWTQVAASNVEGDDGTGTSGLTSVIVDTEAAPTSSDDLKNIAVNPDDAPTANGLYALGDGTGFVVKGSDNNYYAATENTTTGEVTWDSSTGALDPATVDTATAITNFYEAPTSTGLYALNDDASSYVVKGSDGNFYAATVDNTNGDVSWDSSMAAADPTTVDDSDTVSNVIVSSVSNAAVTGLAGNETLLETLDADGNLTGYVVKSEDADTGRVTYSNADVEVNASNEAVVSKGDVVTVDAMTSIDNALKQVDSLRSELGAVQNRFESAITNLSTNETNLSAARSRIEDADYAVEVANMTRAQILQQAGTSVLAQANQIPQNVLSLLG